MSQISYQLRTQIHADHFDAQKTALLTFVRDVPIDEVILLVPDVGVRPSGLPALEECQTHAKLVADVLADLRKLGVSCSVNFFSTPGFSNDGVQTRDQQGKFGFRPAVNAKGIESWTIACPRDGRWLDHVASLCRCYAKLQPRAFWIDDDVHSTLRERIDRPCFCDECVAEMNRRMGCEFDRSGLLAAVLADPPNPVRAAWLAFQREIMLNIAKTLTRAVHEVSSRTRMGQGLSPLELHWAQGRHLAEYFDALSTPGVRAVARPHLGPYNEESASGLLHGLNATRMARHVLPEDVEHCPEIESSPSTGYNKRLTLTRAQIEIGQILGLPGVTLSIQPGSGRLDHERRPIADMLRRLRPRLQAISDLDIQRDQFRGLGLLWQEDEARFASGIGETGDLLSLVRSRPWDTILPLLGFATVPGYSLVTAVAGEMIAALEEDDLRSMFSLGVILDGRAASTLLRIGKGHWAGLAGERSPAPCVQEVVSNPAFAGIDGEELPIDGNFFDCPPPQFDLLPGADVISDLVRYDNTRSGHGIVLFENELGGRVAVVPYDGQRGMSPLYFLSPRRQAQFDAIVRWLAHDAAPSAFLRGYPNAVPLMAYQEDRVLLFVINLSADPIENLTVELGQLPAQPSTTEWLDQAGRWIPVDARYHRLAPSNYRMETSLRANYLDIIVLEMNLE